MTFKFTWKTKAIKSRIRKNLLRYFGRNAMAVLVRGKEGFFVVDPADSHVSRQLLNTGSYNSHELAELLKFTNSNSRILVLGGHIGTLVVPLAKSAKEICVLEANPFTFELLKLNTMLNGLSNVTLFNLAANDKPGKLKFLNNTENSGGSKRLPIKLKENYFYDSPQTLEIESIQLDELFPKDAFDIILMDIEGSEYFAIKGMPNLLSRCKIFVFEFFPDHLKNVSGVSSEQLYECLKNGGFTKAFLPKRNKTCSFNELRTELISLEKNNEHEDGIFLFK